MFGFLRRRLPEFDTPAKPSKGVGVWTLDDVLHPKSGVQETVTPTGQPGVYLHTFAKVLTEAEREAGEAQALAAWERSLAPDMRLPTAHRPPSIFDRPPDPDRYPG